MYNPFSYLILMVIIVFWIITEIAGLPSCKRMCQNGRIEKIIKVFKMCKKVDVILLSVIFCSIAFFMINAHFCLISFKDFHFLLVTFLILFRRVLAKTIEAIDDEIKHRATPAEHD